MSRRPSVSVVIPTLNAGDRFPLLLKRLGEQIPQPPMEIILVDSGSTDATLRRAEEDPRVRVLPVEHFTHGGARNLGLREARGETVVLMTQDAVPADARWLDGLLRALALPGVAAVYSRQIPREDASPMERFFLADRFPEGERKIRMHTGSAPPVYPETFFSNVSAAALRETWRRFPFDETLLMSEDQGFARQVLQAGQAIAYEPASVVMHSHRYTLRQTFRRYFDSVVAFRQLSAGHGPGTSARLGRSTCGREVRFIATRYPGWLPYYVLYQGYKAAGAGVGHIAHRLPAAWGARCSLQPGWWRLHREVIRQIGLRPAERRDAATGATARGAAQKTPAARSTDSPERDPPG